MSEASTVKIGGQFRSEHAYYARFAVAAYAMGFALLVIAAVGAANNFRTGGSRALGGTLIGVTVLMLATAYVVPRLLGVKRNIANTEYEKDGTDPRVIHAKAYLMYGLAIAILFGMTAIGAAAIKGAVVNQRVIGGIALGLLSGAALAGVVQSAYLKTKYKTVRADINTLIREENQLAAQQNAKKRS